MERVHVHLLDCEDFIKCITIVRRFQAGSIAEIRSRIQNQEAVISFDWNAFDVLDDLAGKDPKEEFLKVLSKLTNASAVFQLMEEDENGVCSEISFEQLKNRFASYKETKRQIDFEDEQML